MNRIITLVAIVSLGINLFKAPVPFEAIPLEERAEMAQMSVEDFVLISSVVESESNRRFDEGTEARRYIALCILCRVMDTRFPNTIQDVLCQSGQFSTVRGGVSRNEQNRLIRPSCYRGCRVDKQR